MKTARIKTEIFFSCLGSQFSMASDLSGLIVFLIIGALIVGFIAYAFLSNRLANDKRKDLIRAFRASPKIIKDGPILVKGPAEAPDLLLPTTGEHVTFYCLFIVSRESAIAETRDRTYVKIGGFGQRGSHITSAKGFRIFETSGDFIVSAGDTPYLVSVKSIIAYFAKGAAMFTGFAGDQVKGAGLSETLWNDTINFQAAEPALKMLCGFSAPVGMEKSIVRNGLERTDYTTSSIVTVTSRIDSRIHSFIAGQNIPQGIQELLTKHGIVTMDKEEIIVAETFIPLKREVCVFGTFDGDRSIVFQDGTVNLSVSYVDPEME